MQSEDIDALATRLAAAHAGAPVTSIPAPPETQEEAYDVQRRTVERLGAVGGWKHALLGGADLACGPVLASAVLPGPARMPYLPGARAEVELVLRLDRPVSTDASLTDIRNAIGGVHVAFEILGSRFGDPVQPRPLDQMADRFSNHAMIVGDEIEGWAARDLSRVGIDCSFAETQAPAGMSLVDMVEFLGFLARQAEGIGLRLEAGHHVLTGARIGPAPIPTSGELRASVGNASVALAILPSPDA